MPDGRGPAMTGRLDSVDTYNPASYRGGVLRLHYARTPELEPWLDRVAVRGEVVVQFWLKPGEAAVTLGAGEEREVEKIPEQLRRFLGDLRNFRVFYLHNLISRTTFNELHLSQTNRKARKKTLLIKVICLEKRTNKSSAPVGDVDRSPPA